MLQNEESDPALCLRVVLRESKVREIYEAAQACSDPNNERYGKYLSRERLIAMTQLDEDKRRAVIALFARYGDVFEVSPSLFYVSGPQSSFDQLFDDDTLARYVRGTSGGSELRPWEWDAKLAAFESAIRSVHVARRLPVAEDEDDDDDDGEKAAHRRKVAYKIRRPYQDIALPFRGWLFADQADPKRKRALPVPVHEARPGAADRIENGLTPAMLRKHYNFPRALAGAGQTIAMMAVGTKGLHSAMQKDMLTFWRAFDVRRKVAEFCPVGPPEQSSLPNPVNRFEASMGPTWIGALAPQANIVIYEMASDLPDPWFAAVEMAVNDSRFTPTILCMTWTAPEEAYYRQYNRSAMAFALAKAAALGITVIAASGDWGVYDGRPGAELKGEPRAKVARAAWPHATFPSSEEQILSVGGTLLASLDPSTEVGWSGPLPPDPVLAAALPFTNLASSGGFSERVPLPDWQREVVLGTSRQRSYSRGSSVPEVLPYGRAYPDVALMAAGPSLTRANGPGPSATGYRLVVGGKWLNYAGGTSMAAPIWASIVAAANSARKAAKRPALGFANPVLYYLGQTEPPSGDTAVLRKISSGTSDIEFRVVTGQGHSDRYTLPGYRAASQWDPVTGLGVPNVANLTRVLLTYPARRSARSVDATVAASPKPPSKRRARAKAKASPKAKSKAKASPKAKAKAKPKAKAKAKSSRKAKARTSAARRAVTKKNA